MSNAYSSQGRKGVVRWCDKLSGDCTVIVCLKPELLCCMNKYIKLTESLRADYTTLQGYGEASKTVRS